MGLLRKLAELVVEFPDDPGQANAPPRKQTESKDVVAAIEEISRGMDLENKPDFEAANTSSIAYATPLGSGAEAPPQAGDAGGSGIKLPAILSIEQVYDKAQIKPDAEGFDLSKVEKMLSNPEIADLPVEIRARSVKMAISSMGKDLRSVLEDAARRDKALDDYFVYLEHRSGQVEEQVAAANAALHREIEAFTQAKAAIMAQNKALAERARQAVAQFGGAKKLEEQRLFSIVAPFVTPGENPVIVGGTAPTGMPEKKADQPRGEKK